MRWLADRSPWWLAVSLAANLFFVGLIGAALAFGPLGNPRGAPPIHRIMKAADPEARPLIEAATAARKDEIARTSIAYRAARAEFTAAMTEETVDPARLRAAIVERNMARQAMRAVLADVFVEVAPNLPQDVRRRMAERRWRKDRNRDGK